MKRDSVARGAIFTVATRWADRLIGIISTIILARLLLPEDFGIIAMASLVIGLVDVFLDLGVNVALIQNRDATADHYHTAWTLRLAQTALATLVVIAAAPLAVGYFNDARIEPVLQVMAFAFVLSGLENIGVVAFQKEMQFREDFRFLMLKRLAGFVVTIVAAWLMRSYWALVIGMLAGRAAGVGISYLVHPMRPRFSIAKAREIFGVSQWMVIRGIGGYVERNLHRIVVGGRETAAVMGAYTVADEISSLPSTALLAPLNRVLFPAFVAEKDNVVELKRMFLLAQGVQALVGIPAAVGLTLVAYEAVRLLLGDRWLMAVPFIQLLSLVSLVAAITTNAGYLLITLGRLRALAIASWFRVSIFGVGAYVVLPHAGALEIAWLRAVLAFFSMALFIVWLHRALPELRFGEMARSVGRPLLAAGVMIASVLGVGRAGDLSLIEALLAKVGAGVVSYALALALIWLATGRPAGAESYLLGKIRARR